jgi:hypothetical protein
MSTKKFVTNDLSPYALAKALSEAAGKEIRPQMIYGYTRVNEDGEARLATTLNSTGKQVVSAKDANEFIQGYLDRAKAREVKAAEKAAETKS